MAVKKEKRSHLRILAKDLLEQGLVKQVKFILFVDNVLDIQSLSEVVWIAANNTDPMRDCFYIDREPGVKFKTLFVDGTRKSGNYDDFTRDWPNVIVMEDEVIRSIDRKWNALGLGPFISSPSLVYKRLVINSGATFKEDF